MKNISIVQHLLSFLDAAPTAWHAVSLSSNHLLDLGFIELSEKDRWDIQPGQRYLVKRNGSSLCAFITPKKFPQRLRLVLSHTDSPALKLKPQPEIKKTMPLYWVSKCMDLPY